MLNVRIFKYDVTAFFSLIAGAITFPDLLSSVPVIFNFCRASVDAHIIILLISSHYEILLKFTGEWPIYILFLYVWKT